MQKYLQPSDHHESHGFNPNVAILTGSIEKAILLKDIYGLNRHKFNHKELKHGLPFAHFSSKALSLKYQYMKAASIRRWLLELENDGWLFSIVDNKMKIDKTKSYFANFVKYDLATLGKTQDEKEVKEWKVYANQTIQLHDAQNEQPCSENDQCTAQNEQRSDQNEQAITLSTTTQPIPQQVLPPKGVNVIHPKESPPKGKPEIPNEQPPAAGGKRELTATEIIEAEKEVRKKAFYQSIKPFLGTYDKEMLREFYDYWTESNEGKRRLRFEAEKFFDLKKRLNTWDKRRKEAIARKPATDTKKQDFEQPYYRPMNNQQSAPAFAQSVAVGLSMER